MERLFAVPELKCPGPYLSRVVVVIVVQVIVDIRKSMNTQNENIERTLLK